MQNAIQSAYQARAIISLGVYLISLLFVWRGGGETKKQRIAKGKGWYRTAIGLMLFWTIAPPLFFVWEYFFYHAGKPKTELEELRRAQEVCEKAWVAGGLILAAAYTRKVPLIGAE
jgi:hypothetical protein